MKKLMAISLAMMVLLCGCKTNKSIESDNIKVSNTTIVSENKNVPIKMGELQESKPIQNKNNLIIKTLSTNTVKAEKLAWWQEGFKKDNLISHENEPFVPWSKFYIYDDVNKLTFDIYDNHIGDNDPIEEYGNNHYKTIQKLLNTSKETDDLGKRILKDNFLDLITLDDTKYTVYFYEKGIFLIQSLPGEIEDKTVKLTFNQNDYDDFIKQISSAINSKEDIYYNVEWLSMMRKSRIEEIKITNSEGTSTRTYDACDSYIFGDLQDIRVLNMEVTKETSLPDSAKAEIKFKGGLIFNVYISKDRLLLKSNHTDVSLIYNIKNKSSIDLMDDYAIGRVIPRAAKPVIYLYPQEKTDCTVKLDYPSFTYTYPAYNNGWNITAYPDGKLINKTDGSEHYYLFWEGSERINWDYSEGFVVKGSDTEKFLKEKLSYMGLTPREYNDFITYWVPRMKDSPYNLITFAEDQYEQLAPLSVTPKPDSILRVHMVFKEIQKPIEIKEQKLKPFTRTGFTVVEWGGTNDN